MSRLLKLKFIIAYLLHFACFYDVHLSFYCFSSKRIGAFLQTWNVDKEAANTHFKKFVFHHNFTYQYK